MRKMIALLGAVGAAMLATPAFANGGLTFVITGDTFSQPYTITNTSTAGENVLGFGINLISPFGFDTVNGGFGINDSTAFAPVGGSGVLTGYTGPGSFADGATSIAFTFNNFGVGKSFVWNIDVDQPTVATVFGSDLVGSTGYADFSNGLRGLGVFNSFGNRGSQFVINTFTPTPGVPEPATWAMMIAGFGVIGVSARARKRTAKIAYA